MVMKTSVRQMLLSRRHIARRAHNMLLWNHTPRSLVGREECHPRAFSPRAAAKGKRRIGLKSGRAPRLPSTCAWTWRASLRYRRVRVGLFVLLGAVHSAQK